MVTILCDTGSRYLSKAFNEEWLKENNLQVNFTGDDKKDVENFMKEEIEMYNL